MLATDNVPENITMQSMALGTSLMLLTIKNKLELVKVLVHFNVY